MALATEAQLLHKFLNRCICITDAVIMVNHLGAQATYREDMRSYELGCECCVCGGFINEMEYDPKDSVLTHDTSCPTREEIRQMPQMSLFSLSCFSLVVVFLQIQTLDRQCLSMFWSPEWIFPVHPSVRLFS